MTYKSKLRTLQCCFVPVATYCVNKHAPVLPEPRLLCSRITSCFSVYYWSTCHLFSSVFSRIVSSNPPNKIQIFRSCFSEHVLSSALCHHLNESWPVWFYKMALKAVCVSHVSTLSASSPVKETPPLSAESQDSADVGSSSQESLSATDTPKDAPTPKPDPDAWIQVEKRHRQAPGKAKVPS